MNKNAPVEHETAEQSSPAVHTIHQEEFMALAMRQMNPEADITEKLTEKHIDKMLDNDRLQIQEKRVSVREQGIMRIILVTLAMIFFIVLICLLKDQPAVMEKVIYTVGGVVAGAIGGYGFGKSKSKSDDDE